MFKLRTNLMSKPCGRQAAVACAILLVSVSLLHRSASANAGAPDAELSKPMTFADTRHLVGRTGFGTSMHELAEFEPLTRADAIDKIIDGMISEPELPMPSWTRAPAPRTWVRGSLDVEGRQLYDATREREMSDLRSWWVRHMLTTGSPQTEKLVLFWHDHFATNYGGVGRRSIAMARQNALFRQHATGSYRALLKAMIRDAAMLYYLDNQQNRKGNPNENFARELLELFTLGEGNYDEFTVKEAARALTGYGVNDVRDMSFTLNKAKHDKDIKNLFGVISHHDGDSLIDVILDQPAAAEHLVKKYWHAYVSDAEPSLDFVHRLSDVFRSSNYNLKTLYRSVLESHEFWNQENRLSLVKSPATLLIGTARSLDYPKKAWSQFASLHALLGMDLFAPPTVAGWTEGEAFIAPGLLLNRRRGLQQILAVNAQELAPAQSMMSMDSPMINAGSMDNTAMLPGSTAPLKVRLAAHLFKGPPEYSVSVKNNDKQLWTSESRKLPSGYDTEAFGSMRERSALPWETIDLHPTPVALTKATHVEVAFLNDAAGDGGDRNLFVDGIEFNDRWIPAYGAIQQSECTPKNKMAAGDLYCAGTVTIALDQKNKDVVRRTDGFSASNASSIWSKSFSGITTATIALEDVWLQDKFFHTLSFRIYSANESKLVLTLDSLGCWPDCLNPLLKCASGQDGKASEWTYVFQLHAADKNGDDCYYENLSDKDKVTVHSLVGNLNQILNHIITHDSRKKHRANATAALNQIANTRLHKRYRSKSQPYLPLVINANYKVPSSTTSELLVPSITLNSLKDVQQQATIAGLNLTDWMLGGVDANEFSLLVNTQLSWRDQLQLLIDHPVYQVY